MLTEAGTQLLQGAQMAVAELSRSRPDGGRQGRPMAWIWPGGLVRTGEAADTAAPYAPYAPYVIIRNVLGGRVLECGPPLQPSVLPEPGGLLRECSRVRRARSLSAVTDQV